MEITDVLILAVESSIAFAGFAGIIATFQFGEGKKVGRADVTGLTLILQFSLLAALIACIPLVLLSFGAGASTVWTNTSAAIAIISALGMYTQVNNLGNIKDKAFRRLSLVVQCIGFTTILINALNALDLIFHRGPGPIIATLVWILALTGFSFSRLLLLPLWRRVRKQEAAKLADATSS